MQGLRTMARDIPGWPCTAPMEVHILTPDELAEREANGELSTPDTKLDSDDLIKKYAESVLTKRLEGTGINKLEAEIYLKRVHPDFHALEESMTRASEASCIQKRNKAKAALDGMLKAQQKLEDDLEIQVDQLQNKLKEKLEKHKLRVDSKAKEIEELETGETKEVFEFWQHATRAHTDWLKNNGVIDLEKELETAKSAAEKAGPDFEDRCCKVLVDWLSCNPVPTTDCGVASGPMILLANVQFPGVTSPKNATAEFDLMLVQEVKPERIGLDEHDLKLASEKPCKPSKTRLVYPTQGTGVHKPHDAVAVEVVAVVECKCSAKQVPGHMANMERGLAFYSSSSSKKKDGTPLPVFSRGAVHLKGGGAPLLFTHKSFWRFLPNDTTHVAVPSVREAREMPASSQAANPGSQHHHRCCLSQLIYMTEMGKLGPINTLDDLVFHTLTKKRCIDTQGRVLKIPSEMEEKIAKSQENETWFIDRGAKSVRALVQHGNLWMLPSLSDED